MKYLIFTLLLSLSSITFSQVVTSPNQSVKWPETLVIKSIETTVTGTEISMQVENRVTGGNFCADRNIYIRYPDGTKVKLIKATGIPVCPDVHRFTSVGEKLSFVLSFPPLKKNTAWFDLVEECSENCFWFIGVVCDNNINSSLNDLFEKASGQKAEDNINLFRKYLEETDSQNLGTEGLIYINIISSSVEAGDKPGAALWYNRLAKSDAHAAKEHVKFLNDLGIKF